MNKKLMIAMVVVGMSALYVRFQVVGMESGDRIEQARQEEERRRAAGEAGRAAQVPETEASKVSTGPSEEVIKNNMDQMWKYEIGKMMPLPPKVKAFLYSKLCTPTIVRTLQHDGWIYSVAFSPDGRLLATGALDGTVVIWDIASGNRVQTLLYSKVYSIAFNPDGRLLAAGSSDAAVIWDVASGSRVQRLQCNGLVHSVAFSPDGRLLATGSDGVIAGIWDVASGRRLQTLQCGGNVYSVSFSPDGSLLATGSSDGAIIWNVASGNRVQRLQHIARVSSVAFSPDGKLLATGYWDSIAIIWNIENGNRVRILQPNYSIDSVSVAFSLDGKLLATGFHREVEIRDVESGNKLQILELDYGSVYSPIFNPNGRLLAMANGWYASLWNVECFQTLEKSIITTSAQYELIQEFELTFENKRDWWGLGKKRPVGRIQATPEQWATFLTLPQKVQELLRKRIRNPYERMAGPVSSSDKEEEGKGSDTDYYDALSEMDVE